MTLACCATSCSPTTIGMPQATPTRNRITGASSGIGEACAVRLAGHGHCVFAGVRKDSDGVALKQKSSAIIPVMVDVTDAASIAAAATTVAEAVGDQGLGGLVNNAGVVF